MVLNCIKFLIIQGETTRRITIKNSESRLAERMLFLLKNHNKIISHTGKRIGRGFTSKSSPKNSPDMIISLFLRLFWNSNKKNKEAASKKIRSVSVRIKVA
ncbi:MAG: hypothetical protein Q7T34_01045 [Candidatus Parcubacteria bacterium]|nr:hypothetical protein [Candidatus Parcubacteria bacterium]